MTFRISSTIVIILLLVSGWIYFSSIRFSVTQENFIGNKERIELTRGKSVTQSVRGTNNFLAQIKVAMGAEDLWLGEKVTLSVLDEQCRHLVRSKTLSSLGLNRKGAFVHFDFPTILDSQRKMYCISITYDSPYPKRKDRPTILTIKETDQDQGEEQLQLRLAYREPSLLRSIETLESRLAQYKPTLVKGHIFDLGTLTLLIGGAILIWIWKRGSYE